MSGTGDWRQYLPIEYEYMERYFGDGWDWDSSEVLRDRETLPREGAPNVAEALIDTYQQYKTLRKQIRDLYEKNTALWEALHAVDYAYAGDRSMDELPEIDAEFVRSRGTCP